MSFKIVLQGILFWSNSFLNVSKLHFCRFFPSYENCTWYVCGVRNSYCEKNYNYRILARIYRIFSASCCIFATSFLRIMQWNNYSCACFVDSCLKMLSKCFYFRKQKAKRRVVFATKEIVNCSSYSRSLKQCTLPIVEMNSNSHAREHMQISSFAHFPVEVIKYSQKRNFHWFSITNLDQGDISCGLNDSITFSEIQNIIAEKKVI